MLLICQIWIAFDFYEPKDILFSFFLYIFSRSLSPCFIYMPTSR